MQTETHSGEAPTRASRSGRGAVAVAVAGATGYTGQELLRLADATSWARWYPDTRALPSGVAYGLTEHHRREVASARLVANPGCYPTVSLLALTPLAAAGLLVAGSDVIIDAKSGVSGRGKTPSEQSHFCEVHGSFSAYGVFGHRHGAE